LGMRNKGKVSKYKTILKTALVFGAFIATNNTVDAVESLNLSLNAGETLTYNQLSKFNEIIIEGNNDGNVIFNGWSLGGYLSEGGNLISGEEAFSYTLTEDTVLVCYNDQTYPDKNGVPTKACFVRTVTVG